MSSILNPLHGADINESAEKMATQKPLTLVVDADAERLEHQKTFRMIFLLSSMLLVFYISGSGIFSLLYEQETEVFHDEVRDVEMYKQSSNPFHSFFCMGIKTSKACYSQ